MTICTDLSRFIVIFNATTIFNWLDCFFLAKELQLFRVVLTLMMMPSIFVILLQL